MDVNGGLVVRGGREDLALPGGDRGVALDQLGEHAAHGLDAQGQRRNVQQQQIFHVAGEHACLDGRADGNALIRVYALERFFADEALHGVLHRGDTGRTADQQYFRDLIRLEAGVLHCLTRGAHGLFHEVRGKFVEFGPRKRDVQVLGAGGVRGDVGQHDVGGHYAGQLDLRFLRGFTHTLHRQLVAGKIDAGLSAELAEDIIHYLLIEVVAAEAVVAVGGQHFEHAVADLQDGYVERTAAQVEHHDLLLIFFVQSVRQRRRRGLVDDTEHFEARDTAGVFSSLPLRVAEVRGHGDDRLRDRRAQIILGVRLQFLQDHCGDLRGRVALAVDLDLAVGTHISLY